MPARGCRSTLARSSIGELPVQLLFVKSIYYRRNRTWALSAMARKWPCAGKTRNDRVVRIQPNGPGVIVHSHPKRAGKRVFKKCHDSDTLRRQTLRDRCGLRHIPPSFRSDRLDSRYAPENPRGPSYPRPPLPHSPSGLPPATGATRSCPPIFF